jgi:hypothetical protein
VQLDERGQWQAGGGGADAGVIALDDPGLFQAADAGRHRRGGQVDALGDLVERQPCVVLDLADDGPVGWVQVCAHARNAIWPICCERNAMGPDALRS